MPREGRAPETKTVHVRLPAEDRETVVAVSRFREARPVCVRYSPLNANESGFVAETIVIAFERVEML